MLTPEQVIERTKKLSNERYESELKAVRLAVAKRLETGEIYLPYYFWLGAWVNFAVSPKIFEVVCAELREAGWNASYKCSEQRIYLDYKPVKQKSWFSIPPLLEGF